MVFKRVGKISVIVHGDSHPSEADWDEHLAFVSAHARNERVYRALIVTERSAPSASQQRRLEGVTRNVNTTPLIAVVTPSTFVRGVVTAMGWLRPGYRAFSPAHIEEAIAFLDKDTPIRSEIYTAIRDLKAQLCA